MNQTRNTRAQSMRPIELLLFIGIFFVASMILVLYSSAQNSDHESKIKTVTTTLGGSRIFTTMLEHKDGEKTILERILQGDTVNTTIATYLSTYEPAIQRYRVTRAEDVVAESDPEPDEPVKTELVHNNVRLVLEYEK